MKLMQFGLEKSVNSFGYFNFEHIQGILQYYFNKTAPQLQGLILI